VFLPISAGQSRLLAQTRDLGHPPAEAAEDLASSFLGV